MVVIRTWARGVVWLERIILGLRYEVRGAEHLPSTGGYIIAAKHQSTYETFKLHVLFNDPAIILKKSLLSVPLWGWYLKKSGVIAIDRSTPEKAILSVKEGAERVAAEGRPLIIFPQGTRVNVGVTSKEKSYKAGIYRIHESTELSVIPMAVNSGVFWPKGSVLKKRGTVVFEFLPPLANGLERKEFMVALEAQLETASDKLAIEAV